MKTRVANTLFAWALLAMALAPAHAVASQDSTPETCAALGALTIKCYECTSSSKRLLGNAAVLGAYAEYDGVGYCIIKEEARSACSQRYGVDKDAVGYFATYWIGLTRHKETVKTQCVESVGY